MNHAKSAARPVTRRTLLRWGATAAGAVLTGGCDSAFQVTIPDVRLKARPGSPTVAPTLGQTPLGLATGRDGLLFVPRSYTPDRAWPLLIALHGAGGTASNWASYSARAEQHGFVFLAPDSRGGTWDLSGSSGSFAFDPPFIDRALTHTFERCRIDPTKIAFAGFSDGASYALSLGVSNGDLFTHLIAFSPGFLSAGGPGVGKPPVYVSHGTSDAVLLVTSSRDVIVPSLRGIGYQVTYHEFAGGHEVPSAISTEAIEWFLGAA